MDAVTWASYQWPLRISNARSGTSPPTMGVSTALPAGNPWVRRQPCFSFGLQDKLRLVGIRLLVSAPGR